MLVIIQQVVIIAVGVDAIGVALASSIHLCSDGVDPYQLKNDWKPRKQEPDPTRFI